MVDFFRRNTDFSCFVASTWPLEDAFVGRKSGDCQLPAMSLSARFSGFTWQLKPLDRAKRVGPWKVGYECKQMLVKAFILWYISIRKDSKMEGMVIR